MRTSRSIQSIAVAVVLSLPLFAPTANAAPTEPASPITPATPTAPGITRAPDAVLLNDGHLLEGTIVERVEGQYVVLDTPSGKQRISWDRIKRVDQSSGAADPGPTGALDPTSSSVTPFQSRTDAWVTKATSRVTLEAAGMGTAFFQEGKTLGDGNFRGKRIGFGGGAGGRVGLLTFAAPNFEGNKGNFYGWRFGSGADFAVLGSSLPGKDALDQRTLMVTIPLFLGAQFGFGELPSSREWKGVMFGFDYRPSYLLVKQAREAFSGIANYAGFDMTLDFVTLHADTTTPELQLRIIGSMCFPVIDQFWTGSLGFGVAFY